MPIERGAPFVVGDTGAATLISSLPSILMGGYLSAVGGNASLWVLNSSAPAHTLTSSDWASRIVFFVGREDGEPINSAELALTSGLTASLSGTGASAVLVYTNRNVV